MLRSAKFLFIFVLVILPWVGLKVAEQIPPPPVVVTPPAISGEEPCTPGDQDPFVYRPERLPVLRPCLHVTGTVEEFEIAPDGDVHFNVRVDAPYQGLIVEGNKIAENGYLVVESVCQVLTVHADVLRLCASNPDPVANLPQIGDHVWLEGRYVLDVGHLAWAELHPLYRWGELAK